MERFIFDFLDRSAVSLQDDETCQGLLEDFWNGLDQTGGWLQLPDRSVLRQSCPTLWWKARYAAVVTFARLDSRRSFVSIVGLDGWKSRVHTSRIAGVGRQRTASPNLTQPVVFGLGWVPTDDVDEVMEQVEQELAQSERDCTGDQRGQRPGHRGNQKTPSFLRSVLQDVMEKHVAERPILGMHDSIQGGTTDVGLHTGCVLRSTSFPLVASLIWWLLDRHGEEDDQTFLKYLVGYFVHYLQSVGDTVTKFDTTLFDRVVVIIRSIEEYIHRISDETFKEAVVAVADKYHKVMMNLRPTSNTDQLKVESYAAMCKALRPPSMPPIPEWESAATDSLSRLDQARAAARINSNMEVVSLSSFEYNGKIENTYLQIATLNEFFWNAADKLADARVSYDIADLRMRLGLFSQHVQLAVADSSKTPHIMTVRFRSEEVVAIWVSFCWALRTAENESPILKSYGSALDPSDLQHLVLADIRSRNAVDLIRQFLSTRTNKACRPFKTRDDTLKFALAFGLSFDEFIDNYNTELTAANNLITQRWKKFRKSKKNFGFSIQRYLMHNQICRERKRNFVIRKHAISNSFLTTFAGLQRKSIALFTTRNRGPGTSYRKRSMT
jgi:hypothetical protein